MSGASNNFKRILVWFTSGFAITLAFLIIAGSGVASAQRPPDPRPTPPPSAQLTLLDTNRMVTPTILQPGELMTYTVRVTIQGTLTASDVSIEIPLLGNEQFSKFDAKYSGFSLNDPENITDTIRITKPFMGLKEDVTFYVYTVVPTNLGSNIFQKAIFAKWTDTNGYYNKPTNIVVAINNSAQPAPSVGIPTPPPTSTPTPELPTTGPFAPQPAPNQPNTATQWYLPVTKHYLANGFLNFWLKNGAVTSFGWPISEEFSENGMTVQYFERAVFEYHPENKPEYQVLLRSLGTELGKGEPAVSGDTAPSDGAVYYAETGHWLDGRLLGAWKSQGGLAQFGYPLAEAKVENNRLTQWFERTRLEIDLSKTVPLVEIAKVGQEYAVAKGYLKG